MAAAGRLVTHGADGNGLIYIDLHLVHEVTSPQAFAGLKAAGRKVRRPDRTVAVPDHNVPTTPDRLQFIFEGKGRSKYRTVSLFNPNSSNLNDTDRDRVIRRYLKEWGIDASGRRTPLVAAANEAAAQ